MSKLHLRTALIAVLGIGAVATQAASAADGTITFVGKIDAVTCSVSAGNGATSSGTNSFTVTLPTVSQTALSTAGAVAGATPFTLTVGGVGQTNCTDGLIASMNFEPVSSPAVNPTTGNLKNTSGTATNVEVRVVNASNNQPVNLYTSANAPTATISGNTGTFNFLAQYIAEDAAASTGTVNTSVAYSVVYN